MPPIPPRRIHSHPAAKSTKKIAAGGNSMKKASTASATAAINAIRATSLRDSRASVTA
jgi:hypothetical protein